MKNIVTIKATNTKEIKANNDFLVRKKWHSGQEATSSGHSNSGVSGPGKPLLPIISLYCFREGFGSY